MLLSALPTGWSLLGRCRFGTAGPIGPASGCHALAHPTIGVALVDVAPDATPNAEARLRRALGPADFWRDYPGTLPVWHGRIEIGAVRRLPALLAEGFGTLPPLTVPGKESWIEAVRKALADDEAWEVPGQQPRQRVLVPPMPLQDDDDDEPVTKPARRRGWLYPGLATGAVVLAGLAWLVSAPLPEPAAPPPIQVAAAPATMAPAGPPQPAAASPAPSQPVAAQPEPPLPPMERVVVALPAPVRQPPPVPVAVPAPPVAAAPLPMAPPAEAVPESRAAPLPEEVALVLPPPAPPPAPPLRRVAAPRIDPGCTRALYRYQQGETLTATEAAHVRNGCATRR